MSADPDLSALLPEAPPPRPAAREAAIGEALRRFDGAPAPRKTKPGTRWTAAWRRPQVGILIAASLVGVIALPVWMIGDKREITRPPQAETDIDIALAPAPVGTPSPFVAAPPEQPRPAPEEATPKAEPSLAASAVEPRESVGAAKAEAFSDLPALAAPPPPPPPPAVVAAAPAPAQAPVAQAEMADSADRDIVVTGAMRQSAREEHREVVARASRPKRAMAEASPAGAAPSETRGRGDAHLAEGLRRARQGDLGRAIAAFDRALAADPRSAAALYNRGLAYRRMGDEARALADLDRAAELDPKYRR